MKPEVKIKKAKKGQLLARMASLGGVDTKHLELPKVDFSGLDITKLDGETWAMARLTIAQALKI